MDITLHSPILGGRIRAISSKSEAHRLLICAALSDKPTKINCTDTNNDINATASCLRTLGADISRVDDGFLVTPIGKAPKYAEMDCGESGSTLRFLLPIISALGVECDIHMHGRLPLRPLSPLYELLEENGIRLSPQGSNPLHICGRLSSGNYSILANVSSQFISGLLFALPLCNGCSSLMLDGKVESLPYIRMTLEAMRSFGVHIEEKDNCFTIPKITNYVSNNSVTAYGDWSNAAFFLAAGAIGDMPLTISGLDVHSLQGDKQILALLSDFGANVTLSKGDITVTPRMLHGIEIDASNIPDLVPILCVVASVSEGQTRIFNAGRLRIKESDRISSTCNMLASLGADIIPTEDGMIINGKKKLSGGIVDSCGDHRIAMSAAIASIVSSGEVTITNFEAVNKSYPDFLRDFKNLTQ